jgi:hypothetical protein
VPNFGKVVREAGVTTRECQDKTGSADTGTETAGITSYLRLRICRASSLFSAAFRGSRRRELELIRTIPC